MHIYGDLISGNCLKVKYVADALGLPYQWHDVDIVAGEARTDEFLSLNPAGQVPLVRWDDGRTLAQSNAIIRYLAEGSELLPDDPFARAEVDQWLFWEQYSHEPYIAVCRFHMLYMGRAAAERDDWRVERGELALDLMQAHLEQRSWFVGESFTIADIALLAYTRLAHEGGFDLTAREPIVAWARRCESALDI